MKTITVSALTTLDVIGSFRIPISTDQTEKISSLLEMRKHWGVPRPFHGEFGNDPIEEGFLYIWAKRNVTVLYLAKKFKPTMLQKALGKHPDLLIKTRSIPHSQKGEILNKVAQLIGQWSKRHNEGGVPSSFFC